MNAINKSKKVKKPGIRLQIDEKFILNRYKELEPRYKMAFMYFLHDKLVNQQITRYFIDGNGNSNLREKYNIKPCTIKPCVNLPPDEILILTEYRDLILDYQKDVIAYINK
jgi:hypothetical protein